MSYDRKQYLRAIESNHNFSFIFELSLLGIQISFWYDYFNQVELLNNNWVKLLYAVLCFIFWVGLYGFMKIFSKYSHFILTVIEVFKEIRVFLVMSGIVLFAFANFFMVMDEKDDDYIFQYIPEEKEDTNLNILYRLINSVLATSFLGLGDFSGISNIRGHDTGFIWIFFIMATFVFFLVFMNLLITIIGNALNDTLSIQD